MAKVTRRVLIRAPKEKVWGVLAGLKYHVETEKIVNEGTELPAGALAEVT